MLNKPRKIKGFWKKNFSLNKKGCTEIHPFSIKPNQLKNKNGLNYEIFLSFILCVNKSW